MDRSKGLRTARGLLCFFVVTHQGFAASAGKDVLYSGHDWKSFANLPQAQASIVFDRVDVELLAAAIFHETNHRRMNHNLPLLTFDAAAARAAEIQAQIMMQTGDVSHEHPKNAKYATLTQRLTAVGLEPRFAAENIAYTFAVQYHSADHVYVREENGQKVFSYKPNGPPVASHTYISFAKSVVDQWMNSPGHRENLLHREPRFLGVGCRPAKDDSGLPMIYCCQVFYTPQQQQ
ncbi:MAG TPA: CAP domain-containing protein [Candidatus Binatia bacterium]|nr:CAP domain-containing protein [Candidatus Binatia bacterium]